MSTQPQTVRELIDWGAARLARSGAVFGHGTDNAHDEAVLLVCHALGLRPDAPRHVGRRRVAAAARARARELVLLRARQRIPAAYLVGEAWFAGLAFTIDRRVAVPRSPIAELIERGFAPWYRDPGQPILDLCTGSGCIAVASAVYLPATKVDAVDLSAAAVELAGANARRHRVANRVKVWQSDLFAGLGERRYGLIATNPPYVGAAAMAALPREYRFEPVSALASGEDGLDLPLQILAGAAAHLRPGGSLIMEVGDSEPALNRLFPRIPFVSLEFRRGGHGVVVVSRDDLIHHRATIDRELARRE